MGIINFLKIKIFTNYIITSIFLIVFLSCRSHDYYRGIRKCTNEYYNNYTSNFPKKADVFDSIKKFEHFLLKKKLLKDKTKNSYRILINANFKLDTLDTIIKNIKSVMPFFYEFNNSAVNMVLIYNGCPTEVILSNPKTLKKFSQIHEVYEKIPMEGYPTTQIINELSYLVNYNNDLSRLMFCNLIYLNWKNRKYHSQLSEVKIINVRLLCECPLTSHKA